MSAHELTRHLAPAVRDQIEAYLATVEGAASGVDSTALAEAIDDLRAHLAEVVGAAGTVAEARDAIADLGPAEALATEMREALGEPGTGETGKAAVGAGSILGIPYDVRVPTAERIASRWWNTADARVIVPRVFGLGWTVNFAALAVRCGFVRPDDEDEPFGEVPQTVFAWSLAVPLVLTAAVAVSYALLAVRLPAELPVHWNAAGVADDWWPQASAVGLLLAIAAVPTAWACWSVARRRRPLAKGASVAAASMAATIAAAVWAQTLATALAGFSAWWAAVVMVLCTLAVPFAVLMVFARAGRSAEIRRDIARARESRR